MEKLLLEKVIEKLEKLDIHEWKWVNKRLVTRTNGMTVYLYKEPIKIPTSYCLELTNEEDVGLGLEYGSSKKEKELVKKFYEKILETYDKYKKEELQEMLDNFLKE